jgi:hypothetical protein
VDELCDEEVFTSRDVNAILGSLPRDLSATYARKLERIRSYNPVNAEVIEIL